MRECLDIVEVQCEDYESYRKLGKGQRQKILKQRILAFADQQVINSPLTIGQ